MKSIVEHSRKHVVKVFYILWVCSLLSCKKEEKQYKVVFRNSNFGSYSAFFKSFPGRLDIDIDEQQSIAEFDILIPGVLSWKVAFTSTDVVRENETTSIYFRSSGVNGQEIQIFKFTVEGDGSNPKVSEFNFDFNGYGVDEDHVVFRDLEYSAYFDGKYDGDFIYSPSLFHGTFEGNDSGTIILISYDEQTSKPFPEHHENKFIGFVTSKTFKERYEITEEEQESSIPFTGSTALAGKAKFTKTSWGWTGGKGTWLYEGNGFRGGWQVGLISTGIE